ncbi:MAG TPA: sigma-54 dependent transcriptional regulator [Tepidisphaeraceae bacterium]|nr:sigma-54 dependent transcriptional regulator [Tepidisphaeraceae bacterium]
MAKILIVDDQELMRDSLAATLVREGHEVVAAYDGQAAIQKLTDRKFDLTITDLKMPKMTGMELLAEAKKLRPDMPVVLMTAFASVQTAVEAMKLGAYDYIQKPFDGEELKMLVERTLEHARLKVENQQLRGILENANAPRPLVGEGRAMQEVKKRIQLVGKSSATVLIRGPSGTGKEVASRAIHHASERKEKPFLAVNCAALSESLLESELFGHEKGAFTGADKMRRGRFELADGGTLLLDEISEIAPGLQAKLLRVLQENSFERVGSSVTQQVDVRIIATSNRDLEQSVREGRFREDLFYRLNVVPIEMPPLKDRREDVAELVRHFLSIIAKRERSAFKHIEPEAIQLLEKYHWPGNVRELQNLIERAVILEGDPGVIRASTIEPWLKLPDAEQADTERFDALAGKPLAVIEKHVIISTLERFKGHRVKTASALGIGVRTLGMKIKKWKDDGEYVEA